MAAAPIELGELLRDSLFTRAETAVMTSATLTTRKRFDFLRGRLGISRDELEKAEVDVEVREDIMLSPFDFESQSLLAIPTDLPSASAPGGSCQAPGPGGHGGGGYVGFDGATAQVLTDFAHITDGGLFALFTSYGALRRVAGALREASVDGQWPLFVQGEGDRHRLLDQFVSNGRGILLGTSSFWEGVDVPGDPLRGLLIQKLPFRVPTEPITAARMEALERQGLDPFHNFMLPHAALRLKQGFGRLIRSRADRGAVLMLDDRILTKRYGRYLRESLPAAPLVKGAWSDVERRIRDFYAGA
jgi:ATP-dependent DNA helicase DinG